MEPVQRGRLRAPPAAPAWRGSRTRRAARRRAYRAYRRRQAVELLELVPRDALRPLYRAARRWAVARDRHDPKDPMRTLHAYCEHLLPLPPFDVWTEHAARHADAHLDELERARSGAGADAPIPTEERMFEAAGEAWNASLNLYHGAGAWRGFVVFGGRRRRRRSYRTAAIFRERTPREVVARFRDLDDASLRSFLRSVRP